MAWDFLSSIFKTAGKGSSIMGGINLAVQGYSLYQSRKQANQIEATGQQNAELLQLDAQQARASARDRIKIRRLQARKDVGAQRAAFAASGVAVFEGSPLLVYNETLANAQADVDAIEEETNLNILRAKMGGQIQTYQANSLAGATRINATKDFAGSILDTFTPRPSLEEVISNAIKIN